MKQSTFLQLNSKKLRFGFAVTACIFLVLVIVVLAIAWFNDARPSIGLIIVIFISAGLLFPLFILFLGWLGWLYKSRKKRNTFSKAPFDELDRLGFRKVLVNDNSKWVFTEEAWEGEVNGFTIRCDVVHEKYHLIEMEALCARRQIDKAEFVHLSEKFKQYDIEFGFGSLVKQYDTRRMSIYTARELKNELEHFTTLLKQEGFEPVK